MRTTRTALYFHPEARCATSSKFPICYGEPVLTPAGESVEIDCQYNGRMLLKGTAGYVWADPRDLKAIPGT